ncbi:MAG: ArsR family transcriptional regulator [Promethearchaeota archaeon]|nr:MAG: ArsR family transcriptional regulator [Candidatus Lokiarchaeota archaeon]
MSKDRLKKHGFIKIFSNKNQVKILFLLADQYKNRKHPERETLSLGEIRSRIKVSMPTLKRYMGALENAGLVQKFRSANTYHYRFIYESEMGKLLDRLMEMMD